MQEWCGWCSCSILVVWAKLISPNRVSLGPILVDWSSRVVHTAVIPSIGTRCSRVSLVWILNIANAWSCRWPYDPPFHVQDQQSSRWSPKWRPSHQPRSRSPGRWVLCTRRQLFSVQCLCTAAWCAAWCTVPTTQREIWAKNLGWRTYWRVRVTRGVRTVTWSGKEHRLNRNTHRWVDLICGVCEWAVVQMTSSLPRDADFHRCEYRVPKVRGQFLVMRSKAWTSFGTKWWTFTFDTFR